MISRLLALAACAGFALSANAAKPKPQSKTWSELANYVLQKGSDKPIKAPGSRTLGYESDSVPAKCLRVKSSVSKDKKEHAVCATYATDEKGTLTPVEVVFGVTLVTTAGDVKSVEGHRVRVNLEGKPVSVMSAKGRVGEVVQDKTPVDSPIATALMKSESSLYLKTLKWETLTE